MKILNWYVLKQFLISFIMAIGILTFCMIGARVVPVLEYVAQGVPIATFGKFMLYTMPIVLTFTIPLAVMVSVMLVFGRLSADSEITAMRACGVSILQLMSPIMILTVGLTALCLYLQVQLGPPMLEKARNLFSNTVIDNPGAFIQPGKQLAFEDTSIYVTDKKELSGDSFELYGIQIFRQEGSKLADIQSESGRLVVDRAKEEYSVILNNAVVRYQDGNDHISVVPDNGDGTWKLTLNYGKLRNADEISQRAKFMTMRNLMASIKMARMLPKLSWHRAEQICDLEVELNERIAFALSPLAFLLLGVPLAIRTSRRETSVGLFIGAVAGGFFFLSIILCESFSNFPQLYPQYLLWLPNILYQIVGGIMVYRISRK
ncbi:MAG: LptF/LptG family permease [Victivallaceae bacterium]|nr:LptF/LptG family permease [Victivallaceae bacterium]